MAAEDSEGRYVLFPEIEPFDSDFLKVSELHEVYYEQSGQPNGKPVIFIHGGPGGGTSPSCRRFFDPDFYRILLMDQRGCGKSKPLGELKENTTWDLVDDLEKLRNHLGIEQWLVFGGSWGSTLSLAYSIKHPDRVKGLVLRGIFTLRRSEVLFLYQDGASHLFPDFFEDFVAPIPKVERGDLISAYHRRLTSDDKEVQLKYSRPWAQWEKRISSLMVPNNEKVEESLNRENWVLSFSRIECHYCVHGGFFEEDDYLLANAHKLSNIPCTIVQGRYDMVCPMKTAWDLHKKIPHAEFVVVPNAGHTVHELGTTSAAIAATEIYKELF